MKRTKILFILMLVVSSLFAMGTDEATTQEVTVLLSGNAPFEDGLTAIDIATQKLLVDYPNVVVTVNTIDLSDGSTLTMDAQIAAGTPPNVMMDTIVRSSKYMVPEYAADLNGLIGDLDAYDKSILAPYTRDGKLLGLPVPGSGQGMAINLDLLKDVGYTFPSKENWTIAEFYKLAELVKAKYDGEKWVTGMFAANQSGDYLINNWFAAFGCEYYKPGDYSKTTIASTGGAKVYEFFQDLVENEYIPPNAAQLTDDDYVLQWAKGNLAVTAFFEGWMKYYFDMVIEQGFIDKPFNYVFYPFPKAEGVDKVPTYYMNGVYVVNNTGTEIDKIAAKLVEYMNGADIQSRMTKLNQLPTRADVVNLTDNVHNKEIADIIAENGIFDVGLTNPTFPIIRPLHYPILQKVLTGEYTPERAIALYEKSINAELK